MKYLIKNGRVIDPADKIDEFSDVFIAEGKIERIGKNLNVKPDEVIDAKDRIVAPGLVDMHVHLREPGREDKETMRSGTRAALKGGFTSVACMPNTEPPIDNPKIVKLVRDIIKKDALCNVFIISAITKGREGKVLADFDQVKKTSLAAVSDDGACVEDANLMLKALKECKKSHLLLIDHCEDTKISSGGVINKGFVSTKMGLRGIPKEAEYKMVKRDIELAKKASTNIHIAHVSCKESIDLIRKAKSDGIKVSAETAPHYFSLTEDCCVTYDTNTKMNPPLRTTGDVNAIKEALSDGTIDAIATDHAPHTDSEKGVEFDFAPFGVIGLETALSLAAVELVERGALSWPDAILKMSTNPARILGLDKGGLKTGGQADIVIIDPNKEYVYEEESIESKCKNSPFIGWRLKAKVTHVFVAGELVMNDEVIIYAAEMIGRL